MVAETISRTDLARRTREVIDAARRRGPVMVESYGEEQVAVLDVMDYRLLQAMAAYQCDRHHETETLAAPPPRGLTEAEVEARVQQAGGDIQAAWNAVLEAYLDVNISLGRAAELLSVSRWELQDRMHRLDLPLLLGPSTMAEVEAEVRTALRLGGH